MRLPEEHRPAVRQVSARVVTAVVEEVLDKARREPFLAQALLTIYGAEPGRELRVASWGAD